METFNRGMASNSLKVMLPSLQSVKVSREPILCLTRNDWHYAPRCLLQPYHFKSRGYGPEYETGLS